MILVGAQALAPKLVQLGFDQAGGVVEAGAFTFTPLDVPAVPVQSVEIEARGTTVRITLDTEMTPDVRYRVSAAGAGAAVFAGFRPPRPAARRFDLWTMLPRHNRRDDVTGDLRRFVACLQEVIDLLLAEIDRFPDLFDLERVPAGFVGRILADLGNPFPFDLDTLGQRRLAAVLVEMYRQKGTAVGIQNAVRFFLGLEVEILAIASTTLRLGESELGVDWTLGPSGRFARYAFSARVTVRLTPAQRRQVRAIVEYLKPAHTHFVDLLEPTPPPSIAHWELGTSQLGETTDLH
ncbi:phage tail protein [Haliangium ochraceum]|uniref:Phage tail protein n=1 Tax=Haliangium ochraceum (strain DSM 14365 / JCM 11303 / SMP-2) TaxID=502025 RepID=D0LMS7_HALO1|nr:phage tail protein [Haliangium ochraceum]ACY13298.1 phage tail protein [Haliangium ochraceum DSM 14365]